MAHTPTLIRVAGETLADGLTDLHKIARAVHLAHDHARRAPSAGVLVIRRDDDTVVAAFVDGKIPAGRIHDENLVHHAHRAAMAARTGDELSVEDPRYRDRGISA